MRSLTRYIAGTSTPITPPTPTPVAEYTLIAPAYTSAGIYRESDPEPRTLLRTLWANEYQSAGLKYMYWDGLDDQGNDIIATNDYIGKVLTHNLSTNWSVVGNSSQNNHGLSVMQSYSWFVNMCISGNNVYVGESFNEGGARAGFKVLRTNLQYNIDILPYATDPNRGNPNDTDLSTEYLCTNGTSVFWGGNDPYASYSTNPLGQSWVFATKVSDDTNQPLSSGTSIKCGLGKTYPNAIDIVANDPTNEITGMACDNNYLWVARGSQNEIYCYNATTGAAVLTITGFTNPRKLVYDSSNGGRIWFIQGAGQIVKGQINAGTGNIVSGPLSIPDFPGDKLALGIDSTTNTLAVITGGANQQVWGWNISAGTPSGTFIWKLGQAGGYGTNATGANDRFNFEDNSTGQTKGLNQCYVCFDGVGNMYVGDTGSVRCQVFDTARAHTETIQMFGALYGVSLNMTDAERGYGMGIEFDMTSKAMTYNWQAQIPANFFSQGYGIFSWNSTLSNGRTYATLEEIGVAPADTYIYELENAGTLRDTGVVINEPANYFGNFLDSEFTIWQIYSAGGYTVGQTPILRKKTITSFDGSNNPVYSGWVTECTLQAIASTDALIDAGNVAFHGITTDGIAIIKNKEITTTALYHLEGYDVATGNKVWSTYRPDGRAGDFTDFRGYRGKFPDPRYFERGNSVNSNTFNAVQVVGNITGLIYNGEGWKGVQTNYFNLYHTIGLPLIQFGTDRQTSEAIEPIGLYSSGNGFSMQMAQVTADKLRVLNGDESVHSAIHKWDIDGVSTINIIEVSITPPTFEPLAGTDLMTDVVLPSIITTGGRLTLSNPTTTTWTAQSGVQSYDSYQADISLSLDAASNAGLTRYLDIDLPAYNPSLTAWQVWGYINWADFYGPENTTFQPTGTMQVLDDGGLVITQLGIGQLPDDTYRVVGGNNTILSTTSTDVIVNTLAAWQSFGIVTGSGGATITYGNYTPVLSSLVNPSANWNKPTTIRLLVKDLNTFLYGTRAIAVKLLRYDD